MKRPALSLQGQALALLSRREHSRAELRIKLLQHAAKIAQAEAAACEGGDSAPAPAPDRDDRRLGLARLGAEVDALLDWLQAHNFQSDTRFLESRVHSRAGQHGQARIRHELARLGVEMDAETAAGLRASEYERAHGVWLRRFGEQASDAAGQARQTRFLAARGFSAEIVRRIVGGKQQTE